MKILNNQNGNTISIIKVRTESNLIVLQKYEFGTAKTLGSAFNFNMEGFPFVNYLTQNIASFEDIYTYLETKFEGFELSEDLQNWTITQGYESSTMFRVYLPAELLNKEIDTGSNLDLLIKQMQPLKDFKQTTQNGSVQYLTYIEDTAKAILESYPDIIIEEKI